MQRPATLGWIVITTLAVACGGGQKQPAAEPTPAQPDEPVGAAAPDAEPPLPEIPSSPQPAPASLLAVVEAANPAAVWSAMGAYANTVSSGAGAALSGDALAHGVSDMLELSRADAIDLSRPFRLLVLDPQAASEPLVAVVHAADEKALRDAARQGGRAVIGHNGVFAVGSRLALEKGAPYALTTLADAPAPEAPRVTIYVRTLMERYRQQVQMVVGMMRGQLGQMSGPEGELSAMALEGMLEIASQIEVAAGQLEIDPATATGTFAITPIAGSGLARFIGAQEPASFALLERVPQSPVAFAGRMDLEPVRDSLDELFRLAIEMSVGSGLGDAMNQFWRFYEHVTGEMAGSFSVTIAKRPKFSFAAVADISRPAELRKMLTTYYRDIEKAARKERKLVYTYRPRGLRHRGVTLDQITMKLGPNATDRERQMMALFGGSQESYSGIADSRLLTASGTDAKAAARALIEAVRGKPRALPAWLSPVVADARDRQESVLLAFDAAALSAAVRGGKAGGAGAGPGAAMAIGFDGGAMRWRMTMPASQVVQMQQLGEAVAGQAAAATTPTP